jgi:predicted nuclease of predicted toxin-antitoxin system
MKAVIDEDLHRSLGEILRQLDYEVFDIRDYDLRGKSDEDIFNFAQKHKAVLFSADLGFANTFRFPLGSHSGVVIFRFPNEMSTEAINKISKNLLDRLTEEDFIGNLIILSPAGIRIRRHN